MPCLLLIAHAPLATAYKAVAEHVFADCAARLLVLDVTPQMSQDDVAAQALQLLSGANRHEVLVLVDVPGATPANGAQRLLDKPELSARVLSGLSVPMLWRSLCYLDLPLDELVQRARDGAVLGVQLLNPSETQSHSTT